MRGLGMFFGGGAKRNDPVKLENPHPVTDYGDDVHNDDAGKAGFTVLSKAHPNAQGSPPPIQGVIGPAYQGPDQSFEQ